MKKYLYFLMVAILATMTLSLASCKDDKDKDEPDGGNLIGTWMMEQPPLNVTYIQFKSNGDFVRVDAPYDDSVSNDFPFWDNEILIRLGQWVCNGDNCNIIFDGEKYSFKIEKITSKQLHIVVAGIKAMYERVPDSTIDKYLE